MIKYSINVAFKSKNRRDQRHQVSTLAQAQADATDLRDAIAGRPSKRSIKTKGRWRLAPYWEGAVVTVEAQEITPWRVIDDAAVTEIESNIKEDEDVQIRLAI